MKRILGTIAATALLSGGIGVAAATTVFTPPPNPDWMSRPCATPDHYYITNCYWNKDQMGDPGTGANYFVHNFEVQDSNDVQHTIRCYFYSYPQTTGSKVDHCVSTNGIEKGVLLWSDPTGKRHHHR